MSGRFGLAENLDYFKLYSVWSQDPFLADLFPALGTAVAVLTASLQRKPREIPGEVRIQGKGM